MWRLGLLVMVLMASVAGAQVPGDPQAAAPVVYSGAAQQGAPQEAVNCGDGAYNADAGPGSCDPNSVGQMGAEQMDPSAYVPDYAQDGPDYADSPNFYLGVSLLPAYWGPGFGFGWPYYAYAPFGYGFGWPYYGIAGVGFGFGFGWPYYAFGGHFGAFGYHGPYRYAGGGRYWDQGRGFQGHGYGARNGSGFALRNAQGASGLRGGVDTRQGPADLNRTSSSRTATGSLASSQFANNAARGGAMTSRTGVLPSASYAAAARPAASYRVEGAGTSAGASRTAGARGNYWVASMPNSRGYSTTNYHGNSASSVRSSGYAPARNYAVTRGSYPMGAQRNAFAGRSSYGYGRPAAQGYSRGGSAAASRGGGGSGAHASGSRGGEGNAHSH
jgi:hypothetical protein